MNTPFFIVGSGRSGSTLLRIILCTHSRVTIPPETYFIAPLVWQLPTIARLDQQQTALALEIITSHYRWPDMGITKDHLVNEVAKTDRPFLRDILNVIYDHHVTVDKKQTWGDKTPIYISILPQLAELYPNAKFIHLIRDGRDVTISFKATGWSGVWLHNNTAEWANAIKFYKEYENSHPGPGIYEVRYEDLVLDTEQTIRKLCDYLNIEYEPGMLEWKETLEGKIPAREAHIHKKLARKPKKSDINRWMSEMTKREILVTESFISKQLTGTGYKLYYSNNAWGILFFLTRQYCTFVLPVYTFLAKAHRYIYTRFKQ